MAMLSILGLYNYDNTIFDGFRVPEGMDKDNVIQNICFECAELGLVYPDPDIMKLLIAQWTSKDFNIWEKLFATENLDYNPIWNVDATIEEHETIEREKVNTLDRSVSGSENNSETMQDNLDGTTTQSVAGYNSSDWQQHDKTDVDNGRHMTDTQANTSTGREEAEDTENEDHTRDLETRRTGNIGVTTTQQMIKEQREVVQFNTTDFITRSFKKRFCLLIY